MSYDYWVEKRGGGVFDKKMNDPMNTSSKKEISKVKKG